MRWRFERPLFSALGSVPPARTGRAEHTEHFRTFPPPSPPTGTLGSDMSGCLDAFGPEWIPLMDTCS
jgi:hypothetical protein